MNLFLFLFRSFVQLFPLPSQHSHWSCVAVAGSKFFTRAQDEEGCEPESSEPEKIPSRIDRGS